MAVVPHTDCATMLHEIFRGAFGGAVGGAYRITREQMIRITGRPVFHKTSVEDVADLLLPHGLILVDRDSFYAVVSGDEFVPLPLQDKCALLAGADRQSTRDGSDEGDVVMHTPRECARLLATLFVEQAGQYEAGNYRLSRRALVRLTGRPVIHQTIIEDIGDWLVDQGLILVDRDSYFVILRHDYFSAVRWVDETTLEEHDQEPVFGEPGVLCGA